MLKIYAKQIRISHWIKNLLLFAPLIFARSFLNLELIFQVVSGFFAFSFAASAIYILNDICDIERDRLHPRKKERPIASGEISILNAQIFGIFLILASVVLSLSLSSNFQIFLSIYFTSNILYSFWLKHLVSIDIILVAFMYLLRVFAGAAIIGVVASSWILLTTFFGALFLITAKRYSELKSQTSTRAILEHYPKEMLELFMGIAVTLTIVFYCFYVVEKSPNFVLTIPIVLFGIFRYLYLVFYHGKGEEPEKLLFDPGVFGSGILWFLSSILILLV